MKVANDCVVSIHYTLTDDDGNVIDSSRESQPLNYLHGAGNIIPGLERELAGCEIGTHKVVKVQPADGYGEIDVDLIQTLPREAFSGVEEIEVGMEFHARGPQGQVQVVVVKDVADDGITIDANHALAGKILNFDVTIEAIRDASPEEIDHGHVH
ncbi:MAG: peptidylprolyl isomerase [Cellvibrionaceae bacterium]|nr:peptidylprolyl isomerase [Cellvibrionaceae bacterium]